MNEVKTTIMEQHWELFRKTCPVLMSVEQLEAVQRAFYAGGFAILHVLTQLGNDKSITVETGKNVLLAIHAEVNEFLEDKAKKEELQ